ncbi:MAG TPA: NUDIX domain-containing protein [Bacteroidia bacterium]|nr:NUDIX domain-containing protein [Bacteroidia bacterium]
MQKQLSNAILIARFQVTDLPEKQITLIRKLLADYDNLAVFVCVSPLKASKNNPLDFPTRMEMLLREFPGLRTYALNDMRSGEKWSRAVDEKVKEIFPDRNIMLCIEAGSIKYSGKFPSQEVENYNTRADGKADLDTAVVSLAEFRQGVFYAVGSQYAKVQATVDIAIFDDDNVLLGRKPGEEKFRFIGGFSDPTDRSFEDAAKREAKEETGLDVEQVRYLGSILVDDWRFREEEDKIMTLFFAAEKGKGACKANDDIEELKWFPRAALNEKILVEEHIPLLRMLR